MQKIRQQSEYRVDGFVQFYCTYCIETEQFTKRISSTFNKSLHPMSLMIA